MYSGSPDVSCQGFSTPSRMPMARGFDSTFGYLHAYNGYLHQWSGAHCPDAYPGVVTYPNGTWDHGWCTPASVAARNLSHVTDLWEDDGPAIGRYPPATCIHSPGMQVRTLSVLHTYTFTRSFMHAHTLVHAYTHTLIHAYTHTHL